MGMEMRWSDEKAGKWRDAQARGCGSVRGRGRNQKSFSLLLFTCTAQKIIKSRPLPLPGQRGGYFSVTLLELKSIPLSALLPLLFSFLSPQLSGFREYSNAKSVLG